MNADIQEALNRINKIWHLFEHEGRFMTKQQVKKVLEYGIKKGYEHTGQISSKEIDDLLKNNKHN